MRPVAGWVWVVIATASITGVVATQSRPTGSGPLKSYHIKPGDLPPPATGVANPPQVVPRPPNAALTLPPGFAIDVFAEGGFKTLRWAMEGPGGEVFVTDTTANTITVLRDGDKDGKAEARAIFAQGSGPPDGDGHSRRLVLCRQHRRDRALAVRARSGFAHRHS